MGKEGGRRSPSGLVDERVGKLLETEEGLEDAGLGWDPGWKAEDILPQALEKKWPSRLGGPTEDSWPCSVL